MELKRERFDSGELKVGMEWKGLKANHHEGEKKRSPVQGDGDVFL